LENAKKRKEDIFKEIVETLANLNYVEELMEVYQQK
jgi:hypothetical protein